MDHAEALELQKPPTRDDAVHVLYRSVYAGEDMSCLVSPALTPPRTKRCTLT